MKPQPAQPQPTDVTEPPPGAVEYFTGWNYPMGWDTVATVDYTWVWILVIVLIVSFLIVLIVSFMGEKYGDEDIDCACGITGTRDIN